MKNKPYSYFDVPEIKDLKELVDYCGEKFADKIAFSWLDKKQKKSKTYKEFREDVEALATYFISEGCNRTHFAMIGETRYELILMYYAVINSGNIIVPIDKEAAVDDMRYLFESSDASVVIHTDAYSEEAEAIGCKKLINTKKLDELLEKGRSLISSGDDSYKKLLIDKDELAIIVYTSGSTGSPKGVMISHHALCVGIYATLKTVSVPDTHFLMLPLNHILAFGAGVVLPMFIGAEIFINSGIKNLLKEINIAKPSCLLCVPIILETFYNIIQGKIKSTGKEKTFASLIKASEILLKFGIDIRRKLFKVVIDNLGGNLQVVMVGGAKISEKIISNFRTFGIDVLPGYGLTEVTGVAMMNTKCFMPESAGLITPYTEVRTVDGEIQIKSKALFLGYYKNPEATEAAFDGEWFKTGDIGEIRDNYLFITGRIKNLIILPNGENVSPEELEAKLSGEIPQINEIVVYEKNGVIVAEIFPQSCDEKSKREIENNIFVFNKNLPIYKQIRRVVFRDEEFSKTTSKKIKRTQGK